MFAASAAAATTCFSFSARAADVNGGKNAVHFRGAAARSTACASSVRHAARHCHPAPVVRCNDNNNDWPAPAVPPHQQRASNVSLQQQQNHGTAIRGGGALSRNLASRFREIANIDPNDPKALDLVGSTTLCKVRFNVPYDTKMGEEVMIIGSHEKLGAWNQRDACPMAWSEGGIWFASLELPAGGVFFYKYVVKTLDRGFKWQEGANNLLVLPEPWDIPEGSVFMVDDNFSGLSRSSQNQLAVKLIQTEKEIVQLKMETHKAKEMTKASLQELLLTREQLSEANQKLENYERNVQTVISSMQKSQSQQSRAR